MEFEQRLQKAVQRGKQRREAEARAEAQRAMTEEEMRRLHREYRLKLTEHIERVLHQLCDQFPGFRFSTVVDESGWGAAVSRDDVGLGRKQRRNYYSRLEMKVPPLNQYHVLDLSAKATIRNKEIFNRNRYEALDEVDLQSFNELIDLWVLEYAEHFAADE